ncbi:DUF4271 domain-containing protein [uncultured Polaribacter sp.]|uniref:DUF4271 domain-containing protein n=1 Tax=uncultured Polaribacter sp. TaxID=174711 RepID=UPI00262435F1|nr:DUF4271 domain-containing protein [uncultured Polaribacter sp.]
MQALEKNIATTNWIPVILVFLLAIIAVLKVIDAEKLKGYVFTLFNKGFIDSEVEEDTSFFNSFYSLLFVFSSTVLALAISLIIVERDAEIQLSFSYFLSILGVVFGYFTIKSFLEIAISRMFLIKKQVRFYLVSKFSYLYSISFFLFISFIIFEYSPLEASFFMYVALFFFLLRFVFHVRNNKKLIFSQLFYFILYICASEIAPLLTLYKLML